MQAHELSDEPGLEEPLDDTLEWWLTTKARYAKRIHTDATPAEHCTPSPLSILFARTPKLVAELQTAHPHRKREDLAQARRLCTPFLSCPRSPFLSCPRTPFPATPARAKAAAAAQVISIAASLHVRELRQLLAVGYLLPNASPSCRARADGSVVVHAKIGGLNQPSSSLPITCVLREAHADGHGGALWQSWCQCAARAAGERDGSRGVASATKLSPKAASAALAKLSTAALVLAIDLYKPGASPTIAEVSALYVR